MFDNFKGQTTKKAFKDSDLLALLCGGHFLRLTECKRSDEALFKWYASIVEEPKGSRFDLPLDDIVEQARAEFTVARATGFLAGTLLAPTNLVISHRLREQLNAQCSGAEVAGRDDAHRLTLAQFKIESIANTNCPQDAWFWSRQRALACCRGRKLRNGRMYSVVTLG